MARRGGGRHVPPLGPIGPGTKFTLITTDPDGWVIDPYTATQVEKALRTPPPKENTVMNEPSPLSLVNEELRKLYGRVDILAEELRDTQRIAERAWERVVELEQIVEQLRSMPRTVDEVDQRIVGLLTTISPVKLTGPQIREELNLLDASDGRLMRLVQEGRIQVHEKPAPNGQRVYRSYFV